MLNIGKGLNLPVEAVTQTFALMGKRGVGKTHTAVVIVEEMLGNNLPVCVVDPIGVWWGLRSSKDGKKKGFSIIIFGGENGDVPLEPGSGQLIADLIVSQQIQTVLDLSLFSKNQTSQFMTDFCERLYRKCRNPLQLVLDEADSFAPQKPQPNQARMLGAVDDIVRRGRARGLGVMLATQRPAVLNKNVLTQIEVLIALRTLSPQDRKAISDWVESHGTPEQLAELFGSLSTLPIGTAWFWSPAWLNIFKKIQVRDRKTFDSSATPTVGKAITRPKTSAQVDLAAIRGQMSQVIEKAAENDPQKLKKELKAVTGERDKLAAKNAKLKLKIENLLACKPAMSVTGVVEVDLTALRKIKVIADRALDLPATPASNHPEKAERKTPRAPAKHQPEMFGQVKSSLGKAETRILTAFFWCKDEVATAPKISFYSGYSSSSGSFKNTCSSLRKMGLLDQWNISAKGESLVEEMGHPSKPTGTELREWLRPKLGKCANAILDCAIGYYPDHIDLATVAAKTSYSMDSGSFKNSLSQLRKLETIYGYARDGGITASEHLI